MIIGIMIVRTLWKVWNQIEQRGIWFCLDAFYNAQFESYAWILDKIKINIGIKIKLSFQVEVESNCLYANVHSLSNKINKYVYSISK
jgi:hypothetical protein